MRTSRNYGAGMTTMPNLKIESFPQTLREISVDRLRRAIISGYFGPGERLVERALCEQLDVSRSVVREAIRYLEAEGLVVLQPRSGPMVARLDWEQARQIYGIRLLLEAEAAADCARKADAAAKAALSKALAALEAASQDPEPDRLYDASTHFYQVIFEVAGHDVAWEIVQRLNSRISRLRALTLATTDRHVSGPARMARIAGAIAANDPGAAATAVREHLAEAAEIAQRLLEKSTSAAVTG